MNAAEHARLRAAGRQTATELPDITPECGRRIADIIREPLNHHVAEQRRDRAAAS